MKQQYLEGAIRQECNPPPKKLMNTKVIVRTTKLEQDIEAVHSKNIISVAQILCHIFRHSRTCSQVFFYSSYMNLSPPFNTLAPKKWFELVSSKPAQSGGILSCISFGNRPTSLFIFLNLWILHIFLNSSNCGIWLRCCCGWYFCLWWHAPSIAFAVVLTA